MAAPRTEMNGAGVGICAGLGVLVGLLVGGIADQQRSLRTKGQPR